MMYDNIQEVLHRDFDIKVHKQTFVNYLEVVILESGKVEYAVPSHQGKLIDICCSKLGVTRDDFLNTSRKHSEDWWEYLQEVSGAIAVWNDGISGHPNKSQLATLKKLKIEGLYRGTIPSIRGGS